MALLLVSAERSAPVARVAGPLIGADLLQLPEIEASAVGVASIGAAGTFDGIGLVAAYLA